MSPRYPRDTLTAPENAATIELIKANDEPRNTGLLKPVKRRYTIVPTPAPNKAATGDIPFPIITGTTRVAAIMARSC